MPKTEPWSVHGGGGVPFWETMPDSDHLREDYEHRVAVMERDAGVSAGHAEKMAYAFFFADSPHLVGPFVDDEQWERQLLVARICRSKSQRRLDDAVRGMHMKEGR